MMQELINRLTDAQVALARVWGVLDAGVEPNDNGSDAHDFQQQLSSLKVQLHNIEKLAEAEGLAPHWSER